MKSLDQQVEQLADQMLAQKQVHKGVLTDALEEIRTDLIQQLTTVIGVAMLTAVPEKDADQCAKLMEDGKHEEAMQIIEEKAENLGVIIATALGNFRAEHMKGAN